MNIDGLSQLDEVDETSRAPIRRPVCLHPDQVEMIEEAILSAGQYGEVRLVIESGRLRFVVVERSFDALKWRPGKIVTK